MNYYIDFETRSEADLKLVGVHAYAKHPSTQVICVAIIDDEAASPTVYNLFDPKGRAAFVSFVNTRDDTDIWRAHNAEFERTIWRYTLQECGATPPLNWQCSAELASACGLPPNLEMVARILNLPVQKDIDGHKLMLKMCKPRKPKKGEDQWKVLWHEAPEQIYRLMVYCGFDVITDREVFRVLPQYSPLQRKVSEMTHFMNDYGVAIDGHFVNKAVDLADAFTMELLQKTERITSGYMKRTTQRDLMSAWCEAQGVILPDHKASTARELMKCDTIPTTVHELLEIKTQMGKISVKKFYALKKSMCSGWANEPRAYDVLRFNAGMTGRWGGKNVQFHNLPRGRGKDMDSVVSFVRQSSLVDIRTIFGPNLQNLLSSCIRGVLVARPGCKLLVGDYKNIEARILPWLAGDTRMLQRYAAGEDMYCVMARAIFGHEDITKEERQLGKKTVLGCGYGMGSERFLESCKADGLVISQELALRAVKTWRSENYQATRYWYRLDADAKETIRTGNHHGCFSMTTIAGVPVMACKLPSDRPLYYFDPKVKDNQMSYLCMNEKRQWVRAGIWGGTLTENIDQATGYDLLAHSCLVLYSKGYLVPLTIHDEAISEVQDDGDLTGVQLLAIRVANRKIFGADVEEKLYPGYDRNQNLQSFLKHLTTIPAWAAGIPVEASGWEGKRYRKD